MSKFHAAKESVILLILWLLNSYAYAINHLTIKGIQVISKPTIYKNVQLDLKEGGFLIDHNAALSIENAIVKVIISPQNPYFIYLKNGSLKFKNNVVLVEAHDLPQTPTQQSLYYLIKVLQGNLALINNRFNVDQFYSLGLLITDENNATHHFMIHHNEIKYFHGGLYLLNSHNALIKNNKFSRVSFGNIFIQGDHNRIMNNLFQFPGNLSLGDAIDVVDSESILIKENLIADDSCYGMQIFAGKNVVIDHNMMINGITYAISLAPLNNSITDPFLIKLNRTHPWHHERNENIRITHNYLSQNRFAMRGNAIDGLTIKNNLFSQKFQDAYARKFWTNNDQLFSDVSYFKWEENFYREAFAQDIKDDNALALHIVDYPQHGGVVLPQQY